MDAFDFFNSHIYIPEGPVFTTDIDPDALYEHYLSHVPNRQYHTCSCCRSFIKHYGGLVHLDAAGHLRSIWPSIPGSIYEATSRALDELVTSRIITGVFLSNDQALGTREAGGFTHFATYNPNVYRGNAYQAAALMKENYRTLKHGMSDYPKKVVDIAVSLLKADALYRSEKVLGPAEFLSSCYGLNDNQLWAKVATAPVGFCTPRSSMVGTLLDDIKDGRTDFAERFKAKMHPLQYQRPQAPPSVGNLKAAEKFVADNNLAPSLRRRFARFDEVPKVWTPVSPSQHTGPVFGHITPKTKAPTVQTRVMQAKDITWVRFARDIMGNAIKMQIPMQARMYFCALVTAVEDKAPWIFQWDNHFNWYVYHGGSAPSSWNLPERGMVDVTGIALKPFMWTNPDRHPNHEKSVIFLLNGARDNNNRTLALFPEIMNSNFHPIRSSIEALSRSGQLEGFEQASACGLRGFPINVHVTDRLGVVTAWNIDRWE